MKFMPLYDVFVDFRGKDVRKTFGSHLLSSFKTKCITSFVASEPLEALDHEAMEKSLVAIPVISQSDSNSAWILKVLSRMLECEKNGTLTVIPIFFKVNPLDILSHAGNYANVQKETVEMVRKWLYAQVSRKSSFHSSDWEDDSELVDKVTRFVSDMLISSGPSYYTGLSPVRSLKLENEFRWTPMFTSDIGTRQKLIWRSFSPRLDFTHYSWPEASYLGLDRRLKKLRAFVQRAESHIIGICGMEGVGKTTLARALYEDISPRFQHRYYTNFRGKPSHRPLSLQEMLPSEDFKENSSDEALKEMMGHRKVLLVADGVDDIKQLNGIIKNASWFGPGSRVIVITHDRSLLAQCGVEHIYEVECPRYEEALAFFSEFAFKQSNPLPGFEALSFQAVHVAESSSSGPQSVGIAFTR